MASNCKRALAICISLVFVLLCMFGCGKTDAGKETKADTTKKTVETTVGESTTRGAIASAANAFAVPAKVTAYVGGKKTEFKGKDNKLFSTVAALNDSVNVDKLSKADVQGSASIENVLTSKGKCVVLEYSKATSISIKGIKGAIKFDKVVFAMAGDYEGTYFFSLKGEYNKTAVKVAAADKKADSLADKLLKKFA